MKKALFPGTFDPPSLGHMDIIHRALRLCDQLYIAIAHNVRKPNPSFSIEEKKAMLEELTKEFPNIKVISFSGLVVDCAKQIQADCLIKGIRTFSDFEYESQMALANRKLGGIDTIFLVADERYAGLSSSLIREIASLGGNLHDFVPSLIEERVKTRFKAVS